LDGRGHVPILLTSIVLWASTFPLISVGLEYFPPMVMALLRYGLALIPLFFFLLRDKSVREIWFLLKERWLLFIGVGLTTTTLPQFFQNYGMLHVSASETSIIQASNPVFGVLFGILLLKEQAKKEKMIGVTIALFGAIFLSTGGNLENIGSGDSFWAFLILLSAIVYAFSGVMVKRGLERTDALTITTLGIAMGTIFCIPFLLIPGELAWFSQPTLGPIPLSILIYLATLPTGLAMVLWFRTMANMELSRIAIYVYLIPVFATAISVLFFGEKITSIMVVAGVMIIAGVALAQYAPKRAPLP